MEVEGFNWSQSLWERAEDYNLMLPNSDTERDATPIETRPWKSADLDRSAGPLFLGGIFTVPSPLQISKPRPFNLDLDELYDSSSSWIDDVMEKLER